MPSLSPSLRQCMQPLEILKNGVLLGCIACRMVRAREGLCARVGDRCLQALLVSDVVRAALKVYRVRTAVQRPCACAGSPTAGHPVRDLRLVPFARELAALARKAQLPYLPHLDTARSERVWAKVVYSDPITIHLGTVLLDKGDRDAIEGALAHELGHLVCARTQRTEAYRDSLCSVLYASARCLSFFGICRLAAQRPIEATYLLSGLLGVAAVGEAQLLQRCEYEADAVAAELVGKDKVCKTLECIQKAQSTQKPTITYVQIHDAVLPISDQPEPLPRFLATHPSLEDRISRLRRD